MTKTQTSAAVLEQLQSMDPYAFESFIGDLWERQGWSTTVSQESGDAGIDVIATKSDPVEQKQVLQVKRYDTETAVSGPEIQQYSSLKEQVPGADTVVVVTTSRFTSPARDRAADLNVKLVSGDDLIELIDSTDAHDLVETYLDTPSRRFRSRDDPPLIGDRLEKKKDEFSWADISPDVYLGIIVVGTVTWSLGLIFGLIGVSGGFIGEVVGAMAINTWIILPLAIYYEASRMEEETDWSPMKKLYAIGGAIPFVNALTGGFYLYQRRKTCLAEEHDALLFMNVL